MLAESGLLIPLGVPGLYARTAAFESVAGALGALITASYAEGDTERFHFPPVINQRVLERNGYFIGFPHLAGCVHSFAGSVTDHKRLLYKLMSDAPSADEFLPTGCALTPAACYSVYPMIAARGALASGGALIDAESFCFRHEPSDDPARLQSFRMREYVRIGSAEQVLEFRQGWLARAEALMAVLELDGQIQHAHDPFFGSAASVLMAHQEAFELKFEMLIPISSAAKPTACMSFNYHETHFTAAWGLHLQDGALAHSACVGFGVERLVLALVAAHGRDATLWPAAVRQALWPAA
jgi:seryl-tRNA synthetase